MVSRRLQIELAHTVNRYFKLDRRDAGARVGHTGVACELLILMDLRAAPRRQVCPSCRKNFPVGELTITIGGTNHYVRGELTFTSKGELTIALKGI